MMSLLLLVGFTFGSAFPQHPDPFIQMDMKERQLCTAYNTQQFDAMAKMYHPEAVLLPQSLPSKFVTQTQISSFYKTAFQDGLYSADRRPFKLESQRGVLHEIGYYDEKAKINGSLYEWQGLYYTRWVHDPTDGWLIEVDIGDIGHSMNKTNGGESSWKQQNSEPIDVLSKIYKNFTDELNSGNIGGAWSHILSIDSRFIYESDTFLDRLSLIKVMRAGYELKNAKISSVVPLHVHEVNDTLWHEWGQIVVSVNGSNTGMYHYSRWERANSSAPWQSNLFIQAVSGH